ncbi:MAG: hypothetical protein ACREN5_04500 [Gemmatimonadales bacterium]
MDLTLFLIYYSLWTIVTVFLLWNVHTTNKAAHAHTQEMLRDIARFLGTERR